jgi:hypothetical protein
MKLSICSKNETNETRPMTDISVETPDGGRGGAMVMTMDMHDGCKAITLIPCTSARVA